MKKAEEEVVMRRSLHKDGWLRWPIASSVWHRQAAVFAAQDDGKDKLNGPLAACFYTPASVKLNCSSVHLSTTVPPPLFSSRKTNGGSCSGLAKDTTKGHPLSRRVAEVRGAVRGQGTGNQGNCCYNRWLIKCTLK